MRATNDDLDWARAALRDLLLCIAVKLEHMARGLRGVE